MSVSLATSFFPSEDEPPKLVLSWMGKPAGTVDMAKLILIPPQLSDRKICVES
jgi:hypothetical protein